jgi:hypothetical protein
MKRGKKIKNPKWRVGEIYRFAVKRTCYLEHIRYFDRIQVQVTDENSSTSDFLQIKMKDCFERPTQWVVNAPYSMTSGKMLKEPKDIIAEDRKIYWQCRWCPTGTNVPYDPPEPSIPLDTIWPPKKTMETALIKKPAKGKILIWLSHAANLILQDLTPNYSNVPANPNHTANAYILFKMNDIVIARSMTKPNTISPYWCENIEIEFDCDDVNACPPMKIELWDEIMLNDHMLGEKTLDLMPLFRPEVSVKIGDNVEEYYENLQPIPKNQKTRVPLKIKFYNNSSAALVYTC